MPRIVTKAAIYAVSIAIVGYASWLAVYAIASWPWT
jgi:hypothetical protein